MTRYARCKQCRVELFYYVEEASFCSELCELEWDAEHARAELKRVLADVAKLQRRVEAAKQYATHHRDPLDRNRVIAILDGRGRYKRRDA